MTVGVAAILDALSASLNSMAAEADNRGAGWAVCSFCADVKPQKRAICNVEEMPRSSMKGALAPRASAPRVDKGVPWPMPAMRYSSIASRPSASSQTRLAQPSTIVEKLGAWANP